MIDRPTALFLCIFILSSGFPAYPDTLAGHVLSGGHFSLEVSISCSWLLFPSGANLCYNRGRGYKVYPSKSVGVILRRLGSPDSSFPGLLETFRESNSTICPPHLRPLQLPPVGPREQSSESPYLKTFPYPPPGDALGRGWSPRVLPSSRM